MYKIVKIAGKDFPVSFGMNALAQFTRAAEIGLTDLSKLGEKLDLPNTLLLVYYGLKDGHRKAKKVGEIDGTFDLEPDDVGDLFDDDADGLEKVMTVLNESMPGNDQKNGVPQKKRGRPKTIRKASA